MFDTLSTIGTIAGLLMTPRSAVVECEVKISRVVGGVRLDYDDGNWVVLPADVVGEIAEAAGYTRPM